MTRPLSTKLPVDLDATFREKAGDYKSWFLRYAAIKMMIELEWVLPEDCAKLPYMVKVRQSDGTETDFHELAADASAAQVDALAEAGEGAAVVKVVKNW